MGRIRRTANLMPALMFVALCLTILSSDKTYAASYVAQYVGTAVNGKWVKVSTSGPVNIDVVPSSGGTLGITKGAIEVETNASSGYRLYISGMDAEDDGYTALYKGGDSNSSAKLSSVSASVSVPSSLAVGEWGWFLPEDATSYASVASLGSTTESSIMSALKFAGVRKDYSFVKSSNSANDGSPENIDIYYGSMVDNSIPMGSYYNTVVYTAFVEGGDNISISPNKLKNGDTVSISTEIQDSAVPILLDQVALEMYDSGDRTKDVGSCDNLEIVSDGTVGNPLELTCTYHEGADVVHGADYGLNLKVDVKGNGVYLSYNEPEFWSYDYNRTLADFTYMQDVTPNACRATEAWDDSGTTYTLFDKRENPNKSYLIRKLKDDKCWMVQNLALEGETEISWEDSDLPEGESYKLPEGLTYYGYGKFASTNEEHMFNGSHKNAQSDARDSSNHAQDGNTGAYYNWNAANAGHKGISGHSARSVCPKGWKLPTADEEGSKKLFNAYSNDKTDIDTAFNVSAYVGYYYGEPTLVNAGSSIFWWSSSIISDAVAYYLRDDVGGGIFPAYGSARYGGFSVRCVLKD